MPARSTCAREAPTTLSQRRAADKPIWIKQALIRAMRAAPCDHHQALRRAMRAAPCDHHQALRCAMQAAPCDHHQALRCAMQAAPCDHHQAMRAGHAFTQSPHPRPYDWLLLTGQASLLLHYQCHLLVRQPSYTSPAALLTEGHAARASFTRMVATACLHMPRVPMRTFMPTKRCTRAAAYEASMLSLTVLQHWLRNVLRGKEGRMLRTATRRATEPPTKPPAHPAHACHALRLRRAALLRILHRFTPSSAHRFPPGYQTFAAPRCASLHSIGRTAT